MSLKQIKNTLEAYLIANVTTVPIKMEETTLYRLNGVALTQAQIDSLDFFIEPVIIQISSDREIMSTSTPFLYEIFFQINIYSKIGDGMGLTATQIVALDSIFREKIISDVVCSRISVLNKYYNGSHVVVPYRVLASLRAN
jgi:hypothetical protein